METVAIVLATLVVVALAIAALGTIAVFVTKAFSH